MGSADLRLLCGPLMDNAFQPFDGCLKSDWHIVSGQQGGPRPAAQPPHSPPQTVSFELSDATHTLKAHVWPYLPPGWQPEALVYTIPERYVMPFDLAEVNCPVVALVEDWYWGFERLLQGRGAIDLWVTDATAVPVFQQAGITAVLPFHVFALKLQKYQQVPAEPTLYDIGFVGNLRTAVHSRRAHYLYRLAQLTGPYRVGIVTERYAEAYIRFFKQCRLLFNYSIHGELNMRCFEALGCGTLMLLEANNQETPAYLRAGEHYVSYQAHELEAVASYYLQHEPERARIAAAGFAAIQAYGADKAWQQLRQQLRQRLNSGQLQRQTGRLELLAPVLNRVWSVNPPFNTTQVAGEFFLEQLRQQPHAADAHLNANPLGVIYYAVWQAEGAPPDSLVRERALQTLHQAWELAPDWPLSAYNLAQVYGNNQPELASQWLQTCLQALAQDNDTLVDWPWGLVAYPQLDKAYEKFYQPWFMAAGRLEYVFAGQPEALQAARWQLLKAYALAQLGQLALQQGQPAESALDTWQEALQAGQSRLYWLIPEYMDLLLQTHQPEQALNLWAEGLGDPLEPRLWLMHLQALHLAGQLQLYSFWHHQYLKMFQALPSLQSWQDLLEKLPVSQPVAASSLWSERGLPAPAAAQAQQALTSWCGLRWQVPLEPAPDFAGWLGVHPQAEHYHYALQVLGSSPDATSPSLLTRVYDQLSDLAQGRLGPDLLACTFPEPEPETLPEVTTNSWLLLLPSYDWPQLPKLLQQVRHTLAPEQTLLLWHAPGPPEAAELDQLLQLLEPFEELNLTLLERLSPAEQLSLLQHCQRLLCDFKDWRAYYAWWALSLNVAVEIWPEAEHLPADWVAGLRSQQTQTLSTCWTRSASQLERLALLLRQQMVSAGCSGGLWRDPQPQLNSLF